MNSNFNIILFEPEIPPNTGNIIRLCANTGCNLHLIHPLGFVINDKQMRRAGLDYHEYSSIQEYQSFDEILKKITLSRLFAIETSGTTKYTDVNFSPNDSFIFGPETRGLPQWLLNRIPNKNILNIPMIPNIRSINLANSVAIVLYEAWRQNDFK